MGANSDGFCHRSPALCSVAGLQERFLVVSLFFGMGLEKYVCVKNFRTGVWTGKRSNRDAGYFNENKCNMMCLNYSTNSASV